MEHDRGFGFDITGRLFHKLLHAAAAGIRTQLIAGDAHGIVIEFIGVEQKRFAHLVGVGEGTHVGESAGDLFHVIQIPDRLDVVQNEHIHW